MSVFPIIQVYCVFPIILLRDRIPVQILRDRVLKNIRLARIAIIFFGMEIPGRTRAFVVCITVCIFQTGVPELPESFFDEIVREDPVCHVVVTIIGVFIHTTALGNEPPRAIDLVKITAPTAIKKEEKLVGREIRKGITEFVIEDIIMERCKC